MDRYRKSREYLGRAKKVTPGAAQTLSKMPARFPQGAFPVAAREGYGAKIVDVDGNCYVDWIGSLGAIPLGYSHKAILHAMRAEIGNAAYSLPYRLEAELAERLCSKIPCAEMVRFVNSGSEATEAAIRTARIATGRDIILTVKEGYHSWFSTFQAIKDWHPGVPRPYEQVIKGFRYNCTEQDLIDECICVGGYDRFYGPGVAAIIMEPTLFIKPRSGFLQMVREFCTKHGIVLIFDEMVTGYRLALAGGQEYFNVTPDLATFGKGMSNGLPIGMLCGKREYMQHAELISGTFGGNALSLAAANAVLDVYESEPVIETMWKRGEEFQNSFNATARNLKVEAECIGYPCKPKINFTQSEGDDTKGINQLCMSLFLQETALHGMLWHPGGGNVCYALTDEDMVVTQNAIAHGLSSVRKAIERNDWSSLKGNIIQPVVTVRS